MDTQETRAETNPRKKKRPADRPADPILSPEQMWTDAGISPATWQRNWRYKLPIIRISARRIGCRQSAWRAALAAAE